MEGLKESNLSIWGIKIKMLKTKGLHLDTEDLKNWYGNAPRLKKMLFPFSIVWLLFIKNK